MHWLVEDTVDNLDNFTRVAWNPANNANDAGNSLVLSTTDATSGLSIYTLAVRAHEKCIWTEN